MTREYLEHRQGKPTVNNHGSGGGGRDRKTPRAERAIDADDAVFVGHLALFLGREFGEHLRDIIGRAAAPAHQRRRCENANLVLFVEQTGRASRRESEWQYV